jgi:hypothetical protein
MKWPAWVSSTDRALTMAAGQIRLIRGVTPSNADSELAALEQAYCRGAPRRPRWRYDGAPPRPDLPRALDALATFLDKEPPLGPIYAARARELCLEAEIIEATGSPRLVALARERFLGVSPEGDEDLHRADELASRWTNDTSAHRGRGEEGPAPVTVRSCDADDPRSLVARMASETGKRRLAVRVCLQSGMASLAATGDGFILVAENKWLTPRDVERTVLHEIEGHALPRARAARAPIALFAVGTARGIDDQEGRAIAIEEDAGFLDSGRKFELGCRHLAAKAALDGADFADIVDLLQKRQASLPAALRIAARVQRGSTGAGGLGREIVYLPARCKLARLSASPDHAIIEEVMRRGRIAADVAPAVAAALAIDPRLRGGSLTAAYPPKSGVFGETR